MNNYIITNNSIKADVISLKEKDFYEIKPKKNTFKIEKITVYNDELVNGLVEKKINDFITVIRLLYQFTSTERKYDPTIENLFKSPKYDLNFIVNAFYFSNYPLILLNIVNKVSADDLRQYKDFLARFYLELGKLLFFNKLQDGSFLNLIKMILRIISNFKCFPVLSTKERISNSVLIALGKLSFPSNVNMSK